MSLKERFVVMCPTHALTAVEDKGERLCPHNAHRLARWWIYDAHLRRVMAEASEERGQERQIDLPLREVPRLSLDQVALNEKERAMPRGIKGSGPHAAARDEKPKSGRIVMEYFSAGVHLLRLALVVHTTSAGSSYRVTWELRDHGNKTPERGTAATAPDLEEGRKVYAEHRGKVLSQGWFMAAPRTALRLKPVPPPPTTAKGKKAA